MHTALNRGHSMVLILLLTAALLSSQHSPPPVTGRVTGTIVEARTGAPLAAVLVKVQSTGQQAFSDGDGKFEIDGRARRTADAARFGRRLRPGAARCDGQRRSRSVDVTIPVAGGASTYVEDVSVGGSPYPRGRARRREPVRARQPRAAGAARPRRRRSVSRRAGAARRGDRRRFPRRVRGARPRAVEHRHLDRRRRQPAAVSHRSRRGGHRLARPDQQRHPRIGDAAVGSASAAARFAPWLAARLHDP